MGLSLYNIKKWLKMLFKKSILHVNQPEGNNYSFVSIQGYYNDLTEKVTRDKKHLDSTEVIKEVDGTNKDKYYFPIAIFQYGLGSYDLFLKNNDNIMKEKFLNHLRWAYDNQNSDGSWNTFDRINQQHPFSSMAQSEGASLLIRGYIYTKNKDYLLAAKKAIDFMILSIDKGGTAFYESENVFFLEFSFLPVVFNGWIFSIFGLIDYLIVSNDETYKNILTRTISTLKNSLSLMDCGYWSMYDVNKKIASPFYHKLHIAQLSVIYKYTQDLDFKIYCEKFAKYQRRPFYKTKAFFKKAFQKLFSR